MVRLTSSGDFKHTENFLKNASDMRHLRRELEVYGKKGIEALRDATPKDTGKTANSWGYKIAITSSRITITWTNSNINDGVPIAIILQYGHGTRNGGYVQGRDYINPALKPIFDEMADVIWRKVTDT